MSLNGTLEDFSPAGILKVLSADGRTGAVRFGGPRGCTVYLHRGQLYFARDEGTDHALAMALVRPGRLSADEWGRAIDEAGERPMVGELLVRDSTIGPDLLASVVLSVIYDPLIDLFRDGAGDFDFEPDTVHWLGPFRAFPVDAIIGEVRKRVREVDEWSASVPDLDAWVEASNTLPGNAAQVTILREDWELVAALSGPRTVADLAVELGRGVYSTARVVNRLRVAGLVHVVSSTGPADVVPIRRGDPSGTSTIDDPDAAQLLAMSLPHRAGRGPGQEPVEPGGDPLTTHIGDAIAEALADANVTPVVVESGLSAVPDRHRSTGADEVGADGHDAGAAVSGVAPDAIHRAGGGHVGSAAEDDSTDGHVADVSDETADEDRPTDPNAAWLADLYAQFIDEPEAAGAPKKRRRGEPNPVDVAFKSDDQDTATKVSTLKRLMSALKKL